MGLFDKKYTIDDEIVKVLMPNLGNGKKITKEQLKKVALKIYIDDLPRRTRDAIRLVNETTTPGVFFDWLEKLLGIMYGSVVVESVYPVFTPPLKPQYDKVVANKETTINNFLDRYIQKILEKVNTLKTQASKEKTLLNGKANIEIYKSKMPNTCYNYYKSKVASLEV